MPLTNDETPPGQAAGLGISSLLGRIDNSDNAPNHKVLQAENDAASITCKSMRREDLRAIAEIELDRLQIQILTAKAFNRDGLDDDADGVLREVWRSFQRSVSPARVELKKLRGSQ